MMFVRVFISLLVSTYTGSAVAENELVGEWQLVSAEFTLDGNTSSTFNADTHQMIKILTDSHFAFVSKGPERPRFPSYSLSESEKVAAFDNFGGGAGRYSLDGTRYTEHVEYSSFPNYEGMSLTFKVSLDGDLLTQEGTYPLVALGLGEQDGYLKEVYRRIR